MTDNLEVMSAGVLHDTIEDCGVEAKTLRQTFGPRVAALVQSETEDKLADRPANETWMQRKEESLLMLQHTKDRDVKILWLGDKLSNIRSFYREWLRQGDQMWQALHQKDPKMHEWYYRTIAEYTHELEDTAAYQEVIDRENNPIEYARKKAGLNIKQLAELLHAPYRTVQDWNTAQHMPPKWVQSLIIEKIESVR